MAKAKKKAAKKKVNKKAGKKAVKKKKVLNKKVARKAAGKKSASRKTGKKSSQEKSSQQKACHQKAGGCQKACIPGNAGTGSGSAPSDCDSRRLAVPDGKQALTSVPCGGIGLGRSPMSVAEGGLQPRTAGG